MNILHVEDYPLWKNKIEKLLTDSGHTVTQASSAEEAIALIKGGKKFDVLITDGSLKGKMSGYDLLEIPEVKQIKKRILVSTNASAYEEELKGKDYARLDKMADTFSQTLHSLINGPEMPPGIVYRSQQLTEPQITTKKSRNLPNP